MGERMDDMAKAMASGESRRSVFRKVLAGIFGVGAVALAPRRAEAAGGSGISACIQSNCQGLRGPARAACVLQCVFGGESNSHPF
jgi:hypothetical protein